MNLAIITQPLDTNYGGILQNYALQQVLKKMGHNVTTIRHKNPGKSLVEEWKGWMKYSVLHCVYPDRYEKPQIVISAGDKSKIRKYTNAFIDKYIDCTALIESHEGFVKLNDAGYDAFIVGSDQCWRPKYNTEFLNEMFLSFLPNSSRVKRLAYAASFGTDEWEYDEDQTRCCAALAKKFSEISVREDSGVKLCEDHLGVSSTHVLDPTLLLERDDYFKLLEGEPGTTSKSLFTYILDPDPDISRFIDIVACETGFLPFDILPRDPYSFLQMKMHLNECVFTSPLKWLKSISDAEMTIVDSFHGMIFSIIFNKPFWVIGNSSRGMSRFSSFLKIINLENRLIQIKDADKIDFKQPIDWENINKILEKERTKSIDFIKGSLSYPL